MATTAKGTPYLESSDLVADYPTVSLALAEHIDDFGGKVLQVVRDTDVTGRSTTSTDYVDLTGSSVTITPKFSTSNILLIFTGYFVAFWDTATQQYGTIRITTSGGTAVSGSEAVRVGLGNNGNLYTDGKEFTVPVTLMAWASPATTSATTYKVQWKSAGSTVTIRFRNQDTTAQLFAIEVSA